MEEVEKKQPATPKKHKIKAPKAATIFSIIAILTAGFSLYQLYCVQDKKLSILTNNIETQQVQLTTTTQTLTNLLQTSQYQQEDWVLAKVQYMLDLAQLSLHYLPNVHAAKTLLQTADKQLEKLNDPLLIKTRQAISDITLKLTSLTTMDQTGLLIRLQTLQDTVNTLSTQVALEPKKLSEQSTQPVQPTPATTWYEFLTQGLASLRNTIIIHHHTSSMRPLLSAEEKLYTKQQIHFLLQQAQWAVLNNNNKIYQMSILPIENLLQEFTAQNNQNALVILHEINELKLLNVNPSLPDLTPALSELGEVIQLRHAKSN